jgi:hypothetical protein
MTKDEIIRMACKTGLVIDGNNSGDDDLFAFANLIAAHKTEASLAEAYRCGYKAGMEAAAVVCENLAVQQEVDVRDECAAAIRARIDK